MERRKETSRGEERRRPAERRDVRSGRERRGRGENDETSERRETRSDEKRDAKRLAAARRRMTCRARRQGDELCAAAAERRDACSEEPRAKAIAREDAKETRDVRTSQEHTLCPLYRRHSRHLGSVRGS